MRRAQLAAAINYKAADFEERLRAACPDGVDVYFDNVGGRVSDAVFPLLNRRARIAVVGQISQYNVESPHVHAALPSLLLNRQATMQGFAVMDHANRYGEARKALGTWLDHGDLWFQDTVVEGFEHTVDAFLQLFSGGNVGKMLVRVAD
jgi:hypothetical protein